MYMHAFDAGSMSECACSLVVNYLGSHGWHCRGSHLCSSLQLAERVYAGFSTSIALSWQVVQVCAEHKKPKKLLKHMASIKALSAGQRNPPRTLVFANRVRKHPCLQRPMVRLSVESKCPSQRLHMKACKAAEQMIVPQYGTLKATGNHASICSRAGQDGSVSCIDIGRGRLPRGYSAWRALAARA